MTSNLGSCANAWLVLLSVLIAACGGGADITTTTPDTFLRVTTNTAGNDLDADGYLIVVDGSSRTAIGANDQVLLTGLDRGPHNVALDQISDNCEITGQASLDVTVVEGDTTTAAFTLHCSATTGAISVTTVTVGFDIDTTGFMVILDSMPPRPVGVNGTTAITDVPAGSHMLTLTDLDSNCTVQGANPTAVLVEGGSTSKITFNVNCASLDIIAFVSSRTGNLEIYSIRLDGTDRRQLTSNLFTDQSPAWSPDGSKIAFVSLRDGNFEIYVMNEDGTNQTRLTNDPGGDFLPRWSPDGTKIVFMSDRGNMVFDLFVMDADGSNVTQLTNEPGFDGQPDWLGNGSRIVFSSSRNQSFSQQALWTMSPDGSNVTQLTPDGRVDQLPRYSPDLTKVVFSTGTMNNDLFFMNSDGSGLTALRTGTTTDVEASWAPDSRRIVFRHERSVAYMNIDGTGFTVLVDDGIQFFVGSPDWRPR